MKKGSAARTKKRLPPGASSSNTFTYTIDFTGRFKYETMQPGRPTTVELYHAEDAPVAKYKCANRHTEIFFKHNAGTIEPTNFSTQEKTCSRCENKYSARFEYPKDFLIKDGNYDPNIWSSEEDIAAEEAFNKSLAEAQLRNEQNAVMADVAAEEDEEFEEPVSEYRWRGLDLPKWQRESGSANRYKDQDYCRRS